MCIYPNDVLGVVVSLYTTTAARTSSAGDTSHYSVHFQEEFLEHLSLSTSNAEWNQLEITCSTKHETPSPEIFSQCYSNYCSAVYWYIYLVSISDTYQYCLWEYRHIAHAFKDIMWDIVSSFYWLKMADSSFTIVSEQSSVPHVGLFWTQCW